MILLCRFVYRYISNIFYSSSIRMLFRGCVIIFAAIISGCSDGSSVVPPASNVLEGYVVDPAISGAAVELRDENGVALSRAAITNKQGYFSIRYYEPSLEGALLISRGGVDQVTGYSFSNAIMRAPAEGAIVSPLTELVVGLMQEQRVHKTQAQAMVASWFDLLPEQVLNDPRTHGKTQLAALKVSAMAYALRKELQPFDKILTTLYNNDGDIVRGVSDLKVSATAAHTSEYLDTALGLISRLPEDTLDADGVVKNFNIENIKLGLAQYFFSTSTPSDIEQENLTLLARAIWQSSGGKGIALGSPELVNLARYLAFEFNILEELSKDTFDVPSINSQSIAEILKVRGAIDHTLALATHELLGMDNDARLKYFYASDLSPFYRAEQFVQDIYDDSILDSVYQSIATGMGKVGLLNEAMVVIDTRIFHVNQRMNAFSAVGQALGKVGRLAEAEFALNRAASLMREIIAAKGGASKLTEKEMEVLISLAKAASKAGLTSLARAILEPMYEWADAHRHEYSTTHGRLLSAISVNTAQYTGGRSISDAVIEYEQGKISFEEVKLFVELYEYVIDAVPAQASGSRVISAMNYVGLADYQDRIGLDPWKSINKFKEIVEGAISGQTFSHRKSAAGNIKYAVPIWARHGKHVEFEALLERWGATTNPDKPSDTLLTVNAKKDAQNVLYEWQVIADLTAHKENVAASNIDRLTASASDEHDLLDNLLWSSSGQNEKAGLALQISDAGYPEEAWKVIEHVQEKDYVSLSFWETYYTNSAAVLPGCVRVSWAIYRLGNVNEAVRSVQRCYESIRAYPWKSNNTKAIAFEHLMTWALSKMQLDNQDVFDSVLQEYFELTQADLYKLHLSVKYAAQVGNSALLNQALNAAGKMLQEQLQTLAAQPSEVERNKVISGMRYFLVELADAKNRLRNRIALHSSLSFYDQQAAQRIDDHIRALYLSTEQSAVAEILQLLQNGAKDSALTELIKELSRIGLVDEAYQLAQHHTENTDYQKSVQNIASNLVAFTQYPNSVHASMDFDGDGKPDFFNPVPKELESDNPFIYIGIDEDMDNDGCIDTVDRRPFLYTHDFGDCR